MTLWDDGSGSALYAFGTFTSADGEPMSHIAKWDGKAWSALGIGTGNSVEDLAGIDLGHGPTLFAIGSFHYAGGYPSPGFAAWVPCPPVPCPADLDGSGALDLFDFLTFLNLFDAEDPASDCDGNGEVAAADFACYSALFAAGCP